MGSPKVSVPTLMTLNVLLFKLASAVLELVNFTSGLTGSVFHFIRHNCFPVHNTIFFDGNRSRLDLE